jgi:hypothetical protein
LIQSRPTTRSLSAYDEFEFDELHQFLDICNLNIDNTITGSEPFPEVMLIPKNSEVKLPNDIYRLLVDYYNNAYDCSELTFITIGNLITFKGSKWPIVVLPDVDQFRRIQIGAEIFGSILALQYEKNAYILAKFIQEDNTIDAYFGQVQFYFDHKINLLNDKATTHHLVFVK